MVNIISKNTMSLPHDRQQIFGGDIILTSKTSESSQLCNYAKEHIENAFNELEPQTAQNHLKVEAFISIISALKSEFTNHPHTKELVKQFIQSIAPDIDDIYFDVPRLRVVTFDNYLSSGVGYAYKPHRDIWYSSPNCQINVWIPIYEISATNTMSFFTEYWDAAIKNSSGNFDYEEWCQVGRKNAASQVVKDTRNHPIPLEQVSSASEIRLVPSAESPIYFSSAHLHQTAPNTSQKTRFSLDFRLIYKSDVLQKKGAHSIDNLAKGSTTQDFISAQDLSPFVAS
jgi:hypothetical protein